MRAPFLLVAPLTAVALVGCGGSRSNPHADYTAELEAAITRQLPAKLRRLAGPEAFLTSVTCVHGSGSSYQCIAAVSGANAYTGAWEKTQLPIDGTCADGKCIWKVSP